MSKKDNSSETPMRNEGWGVFTEDNNPKLITNFLIEVVGVINSYSSPDAKPVMFVSLKLHFNVAQYIEFTMPLSELDKINWVGVDIRCRIYPDIPQAKAQRYLADHIRNKLQNVPPEKRYRLNRLGVHRIELEPMFCAGGEVIRPPHGGGNRHIVELDEMPYTLDYDPNHTEEEAVADLFEFISLFPNQGRILLAYNLVYLMRELYVVAWKAPRFCIYTHGLTDSRKTTVSVYISQLYNRSKGIKNPPRLDSSIPQSVRIIYSMSDCVHVFDDLCPSEHADVKRYQEKTFLQIVRIIGDGIQPGRVNLKEFDVDMPPPTAGVVLNGEYPIGTGSDAARMLSIEVAPPDDEILRRFVEFQKDKPLAIPTFYRNFIKWFIGDYDEIQESLAAWWRTYSQSNFTAHGQEVHGRLRETHYYLNTAYITFLDYCCEKGFISEEERDALHQPFLKLVTDLVVKQEGQVAKSKLNRPNVKVDYLAYILKLYRDKVFVLAPSAKEFKAAEHDAVIHNGCLNIYGERFREIISAANANVEEVLDDIESRGALQPGKYKRTTQIYISENEKRRFYAIKLTHLK